MYQGRAVAQDPSDIACQQPEHGEETDKGTGHRTREGSAQTAVIDQRWEYSC